MIDPKNKPTDALFSERIGKVQRKRGLVPSWTLKEVATVNTYGEALPSMYQAYMSSIDEYDFATTHLQGVGHWDRLLGRKWFMEGSNNCQQHRGIESWREDMFKRDASLAKKTLIHKTREGNASAATALANLLRAEKVPTKGRPKLEDIAKAAAKKVEDEEAFADDIKRLNVVRIRG